jgi:hypothetical protein
MQGELEKQNGAKRFFALAVPFAKKDHFKLKYGRQFLWDARRKTWFWLSQDELPQDLIPFLPPQQANSGQGQRLSIELVPRTCWLSNVRNYVSRCQTFCVTNKLYHECHSMEIFFLGSADEWFWANK